MRSCAVFAVVTSLAVLTGCSRSRENPPASGQASAPAAPAAAGRSAPKAAEPDTKPAIDIASRLDLDGGRVSVFSPTGWQRAPRSRDYLIRYSASGTVPYPSVVVRAADPPEGFAEVTAANHAAFVEAIAARLAEAGDGKPPLRKPATAKAGPHLAAAWGLTGEGSLDGITKDVERDCTAVVIGGRLYTIEAWAPRGKLEQATRAAARAIAAGMTVPALAPGGDLEPLVPPPAPDPATPEPAPAVSEPATDPPPAEPGA